jgi:hypothetical protein
MYVSGVILHGGCITEVDVDLLMSPMSAGAFQSLGWSVGFYFCTCRVPCVMHVVAVKLGVAVFPVIVACE